MKQHYPLDPVTGIENPALAWANGNPATGTDGSYPPFGLFLDPQKEILSLQRAAGLTDSPDGSDTAQTAQAVSRGTWLGTLGQPATANDLTGALAGSVTWPALLVGMEFGATIGAPNTGPMTVTLAGFGTSPGKLNLVGKNGGALTSGDVWANTPFRFRFDGTQFRMSGPAVSELNQVAINIYNTRPPVTTVWVDPANGNDANDGSTPQLARKSIDTVVGAMGANATLINLLGDATVTLRQNVYAPLTLNGVDVNANAVTRMVTFLGTAANSPTPVGTACAGWFCYQPTFRSNSIAYTIPVVPSGLSYRNHITSLGGLAAAFLATTITLADNTNSGALLGAAIARLTATFTQLTMGVGGHLFDGIAGGANPNGDYRYTTNVTSA